MNAKSSKNVSLPGHEAVKSKVLQMTQTTSDDDSDDLDDGASFESAETISDQSNYSFNYSNGPTNSKHSEEHQLLHTTQSKESSSKQNHQQNEEDNLSNVNSMLNPLNEESVESEDDVFTTSSINNGNDQSFNAGSQENPRQNVDTNELRQNVDTNELIALPKRQMAKSRKTTIPKRNVNGVINAYRQYTSNFLPKASFQKVAVDILRQHGDYSFSKPSLDALQESSELYMTHLFEDAYRLSLHRKAVTLSPIDMKLVLHLRKH